MPLFLLLPPLPYYVISIVVAFVVGRFSNIFLWMISVPSVTHDESSRIICESGTTTGEVYSLARTYSPNNDSSDSSILQLIGLCFIGVVVLMVLLKLNMGIWNVEDDDDKETVTVKR